MQKPENGEWGMNRIIEPMIVFVLSVIIFWVICTAISSILPVIYSEAMMGVCIPIAGVFGIYVMESYTYWRFGDPIIIKFDPEKMKDRNFRYFLLIGIISLMILIITIFMIVYICIRYPGQDIVVLSVTCIISLAASVFCGINIRKAGSVQT